MRTYVEIVPMAIPKRQVAWIVVGTLCVLHGLRGMTHAAIKVVPPRP